MLEDAFICGSCPLWVIHLEVVATIPEIWVWVAESNLNQFVIISMDYPPNMDMETIRFKLFESHLRFLSHFQVNIFQNPLYS